MTAPSERMSDTAGTEEKYPTLALLADLSRTTVGYQQRTLERESVECYRQLTAKAAECERLREALEGLLAVCPCQNGCAPDDMTCATNAARKALKGE